ncbi:hypothetical protein C5167_016479 [Papaver somniferum]|nr:hypothetical protein C5167_016479 [Papaver somniferum]
MKDVVQGSNLFILRHIDGVMEMFLALVSAMVPKIKTNGVKIVQYEEDSELIMITGQENCDLDTFLSISPCWRQEMFPTNMATAGREAVHDVAMS